MPGFGAYVFTGSNPTITEDFNGLGTANVNSFLPAASGTQVAVAGTSFDAVKLSGTGTSATALFATDGTSTTGAMMNFGHATVNTTDRALGSLASGGTVPAFGFELQNDFGSGQVITSISISFTQENWRSSTSTLNVLTAGYGTTDSGLVASSYLSAASGITSASALNLTGPSPVVSNGALNGNLAANQSARSLTISSLSIGPGESFFVRWQDANEVGNDAGLGMDGLTIDITASPVPVPEPEAVVLVAGLGLVGFGLWRRTRRA